MRFFSSKVNLVLIQGTFLSHGAFCASRPRTACSPNCIACTCELSLSFYEPFQVTKHTTKPVLLRAPVITATFVFVCEVFHDSLLFGTGRVTRTPDSPVKYRPLFRKQLHTLLDGIWLVLFGYGYTYVHKYDRLITPILTVALLSYSRVVFSGTSRVKPVACALLWFAPHGVVTRKSKCLELAGEEGFEPSNRGIKTRCLRPDLAIPQLKFGSPGWVRTTDQQINSLLLYRLSYWGIVLLKVLVFYFDVLYFCIAYTLFENGG